MGPRIAIIGGGSYQWIPTLVCDVANTASLHDAELVLCDIDPEPIPRMVELVDHIARARGIPFRATGTTDQRAALTDAAFVVVCISTGGFDSMRHDLDIPERYGIRQAVGDTVGPGGILRALRNVPVLLGIAADMADRCPDAWLLNLTNPMTTLCRAVTRESSVRTVGLCHEVTLARFTLSLLFGADFREVRPTVVGVNHLPLVTALDVEGRDGLAQLRELLDSPEAADEPIELPAAIGHEALSGGGAWTRRTLLDTNRVKFELFRRFGVLPAAGDRHLVEFFPGFLTADSEWGSRWGVSLTTIAEREAWRGAYEQAFERLLAADDIPTMPSGEIVAPLIDSVLRDRPRTFPLNLPNRGQAPDLPREVVVETMGRVDAGGATGGDPTLMPGVLGEMVRRVAASQELVVEAALAGDRGLVIEAMLADPLAGRIDFDALERMTDEMLAATKPWLPQFA